MGVSLKFDAKSFCAPQVGKIASNVAMDDVWAPDTISDSADAASGILVYASSGVTVSGNTVGNTQFGIAFVSDPTSALPTAAQSRETGSLQPISSMELSFVEVRIRYKATGSTEATNPQFTWTAVAGR